MAGTWMSIVEGFGGMRVNNNQLYFEPKIPTQWQGYSFKINFRNQILKVSVHQNETKFSLEGNQPLSVFVNGKEVVVEPNSLVTV
jgi:maltose phosphorylase